MWISERDMRREQGEPAAELGVVTLGGDPAGVSLGGERRQLPVYSPGGVTWRPAAGDKVLVLKTGAAGEQPCVIGRVAGGTRRRRRRSGGPGWRESVRHGEGGRHGDT